MSTSNTPEISSGPADVFAPTTLPRSHAGKIQSGLRPRDSGVTTTTMRGFSFGGNRDAKRRSTEPRNDYDISRSVTRPAIILAAPTNLAPIDQVPTPIDRNRGSVPVSLEC